MGRRLLLLLAAGALLAPRLGFAQDQTAPATPAAAPPPAPPAPPAPSAPPAEPAAAEPFAWGDFTWLNGTNRQKEALLDTKYFTMSFLLDTNFNYSFNHPIDHTNVGSTATFREGEFDLSFVGWGGDFHWKNARGRIMLQYGTRATGIARNDLSPDRGQFDLRDAFRYLSEAYAGYHWDAWHGINLDAGIFMSYIGLFSYANFENWGYQPSYTSDNTPWFFQGIRVQTFPSDRMKIEYWLINGWQSYGMFTEMPGFGLQWLWRPVESISVLSNNYFGKDTIAYGEACTATPTSTAQTSTCSPVTPFPGNPANRKRFHTDNSFLLRYYNNPGGLLSKAAISVTGDLGFEWGGGVTPFGGGVNEGPPGASTCALGPNPNPKGCTQNFISGMGYNRFWFFDDHLAWTQGGGFMHNPGRYLVLPPTGNANPVNGGYPFTMNPGDPFDAWDASTGIQYMPDQFSTWGVEYVHRHASVPYFAGPGGVTSATGTWPGGGFDPSYVPDLVPSEDRVIFYLLFRM